MTKHMHGENANVRIDEATRSDLEMIITLLAEDQLGVSREDASTPLDEGYVRAFEQIAADPLHVLLVARLQETVKGVVQLSIIPNLTYRGRSRAQIEGVRVARDAQGKGIGRQLIDECIRRAHEHHCHLVQLTTDKRRPDAIGFYQAIGFVASHEGMKLKIVT